MRPINPFSSLPCLLCVPVTISYNIVVITSLQNVFMDFFSYIFLIVIIVFRSYHTFIIIANAITQVRLACF